MSDPNVPLDDTHRACLEARNWIRHQYADAITRVRTWQPQPLPRKQTDPCWTSTTKNSP